jgi:hypothetical protein
MAKEYIAEVRPLPNICEDKGKSTNGGPYSVCITMEVMN